MKKILSVFFSLLLICSVFITESVVIHAASAGGSTKKRTREIHVVYDDSGSMVRNKVNDTYEYNTRWSEAKYALEVFVGMMGETDTMTIYPMSSYSSGAKVSKISLKGTDSSNSRIKAVNKMNGYKGKFLNTPLKTVEEAARFKKSKADDKWLVILTDGEFGDADGKSYKDITTVKNKILSYAAKDSGINVAYVPIGEAIEIDKTNDSQNFYTPDAGTTSILDKVKDIAKIVFNYQTITLSKSQGSFSLKPDIPISKFIIFAQGKNVKIGDIQGDKSIDSAKKNSVEVAVSKKNTPKPLTANMKEADKTKVKIAEGLKGEVFTYDAPDEDHPFAGSTYSFTSNVDNVEVFFEPGVSLQAVLEDNNGNEFNLSDDKVTSIPAGTKTLHVKFINPIDGTEIDPNHSELLKNVVPSMIVEFSDGTEEEYLDNKPVDIPEGDVSITAKARFKGGIEKQSKKKKLTITAAELEVSFSSKKGYKFDPFTMNTDQDVLLSVKAADGTPFTKEQYDSASFQVSDMGNVEWTVKDTDDSGIFCLTPRIKKGKNSEDIDVSKQTLKVDVSIKIGKIERKGSASTKVAGMVDNSASLNLKITTPKETYKKNGKNYMFDSSLRGVGKNRAYILVEVSMGDSEGNSRKLTEEEWKKGVKGFSFDAKLSHPNPLDHIIRLVCRQSLDFKVEKGEELSTYKLYLDGLTPTGVLPKTSDLTIHLKIKLKNGISEEGSGTTQVTVKPQGFLVYLGWLLLILLLVFLLLSFIIMQIQKPRFDKNLFPNTVGTFKRAGNPKKTVVSEGNEFSKKYVIWPPWKAEEADIVMYLSGYMDMPIAYHCKAIGNGSFIITDNEAFASTPSITINGMNYETLKNRTVTLGRRSKLVLKYQRGVLKGQIIHSFIDLS